MDVINVQRLISPIKFLPQSLLLLPTTNMVRLCLNAQCSKITTISWPTLYFYHFFDDKFVSLLTKRPIFLQNTSGNPSCHPRQYRLAVDLIICT